MKLKTPEKPMRKPEASKPKGEAMPPDNPRRHPDAMPTSLSANPIGMSPERRALYEEAQEHVESGEVTPPIESEEAGPETAETSPEEEVTEPSPEEKETQGEESSPEKTETETEPIEEAPADKKHTTVSHAALHEAREELKEAKAKMREVLEVADTAQKQLQIVIAENERLRKTSEQPLPEDKPDEPIDDIEKYIKGVAAKSKALEAKLEKLERDRLEEKESDGARKFGQAIKHVADELKAEGYPGFEKFRNQVAAKIEELANGNKAKLTELDNPVGWAEVYKEHVYPEIAGVFGVVKKASKKSEKEELKGKANLVGSPGSAPKKTEDEPKKPWGLGSYFEMRQKNKPS